ncbi:MAG: LamG-like jellyroll fold domain-containing protein [Flavobacteriales bacterium]|jgi:hypothetical protein
MHLLRLTLSIVFWSCAAIAAAQVPTYAPVDNLIAWYNFSGDAQDASSNGHNGLMTNTAATTDRQGQLNQALFFDGTSSDILVPYAPAFNAFPLTVSVWVRPAEDDNGGMIIQHYANASWNGWVMSVSGTETQTVAPGYMLAAPPNCNGVVSTAACATGINYSGDLYDNQWHMLTFSVDVDSGRFYFDGVQQTAQAWTGNPGAPVNTDDLHIGGTDLGSNFQFHGSIDEVGLWNRALDATEIEMLFLGMPPTAGCMNTNACNYSPEATVDDGSCEFNCAGCVDPCACNYDQNAVINDGTCDYSCNVAYSFITVFHDVNVNGIYDSDETPVQHWPVHMDELEKTVYTNAMGMIIVPLPVGTVHYTLLNPTDNWVSSTPEVITIDVPGSTVAFFGLYEPTVTAQPEATIIEAYHHYIHCEDGFESGIFLRNKGSIPMYGTLTVTCDPLFTPQAAAALSIAPTTSGPGFANWDITNVVAWQGQLLSFSIDDPGEAYAGQFFPFTMQLTLWDANGTPVMDQQFELSPQVMCEDEAPHVHASPIGYTDEHHYVQQGERITFRTHFLNSTDSVAQDVLMIQNLNSQQFITDSFELLYTSAAVVGCLHDDGTIDLSFNSIQLPPSGENPSEAMGYAVYTAQLRSDLPTDSTFHHEAYAVFDLEQTQFIDSVYYTIFDCSQLLGIEGDYSLCEGDSLLLEAIADSALAYRWYVEDSLMHEGQVFSYLPEEGLYSVKLEVINPVCQVNESKSVSIYPLPSGEIVFQDPLLFIPGAAACQWYFNDQSVENNFAPQLPMMGDGIYRARIIGEGNCESWTSEFVVNRVDEFEATVQCYPNPATHELRIASTKALHSLKLTDMMGHVVWQQDSSRQQHIIDVSGFARGCYCLQIETPTQLICRSIMLE